MLNDFISYLTLKAVEDDFLESLSDFCNKYVTKPASPQQKHDPLNFNVRCRPLVAIITITATKEEVR